MKKSPFDDRRIIAACAAVERAHAAWVRAVNAGDDGHSRAAKDARRRVDGLVARVASTRPTTIAGYRAMARAAFVLWAAGDGEIPESDGGETALLARVLIRDLAGVEVDTADSVVAADVGSVGAVVH